MQYFELQELSGAWQCADLSPLWPAVIFFYLAPEYFCLDVHALGALSYYKLQK